MKALDLSGQKFGRLTVGERVPGIGKPHWNCVCDCGKPKIVSSSNLKNGHTKSCGCLAIESSQRFRRTIRKPGRLTAHRIF